MKPYVSTTQYAAANTTLTEIELVTTPATDALAEIVQNRDAAASNAQNARNQVPLSPFLFGGDV